MTPLFPPVVRFPSEVSSSHRLPSKTIANQRLPTIVEESPLVSKGKKGNISEVFFSCFLTLKNYRTKLQVGGNIPIENVMELRFILPKTEVEGILDHNKALRVGIGNIYLNMTEGRKLLNLFYKDRVEQVWNTFIALPNKTTMIFQGRKNIQVDFIISHNEEEITPACHEILRVRRETISLEISEVEKLWNLFSKDHVISNILSDPITIPDGTLMRVQNKQNNDFAAAIEPLTCRTSNLFTRVSPWGK